ncbi:hypothetical protein ADIS_3109 [Lunatimonas lonarensis]|uniref:Uncharacterized protein n=1 Tax=Lunatimonas lonarensis TaxID=1232681 RepID=R7ZRP9_9BACT|nr:hypothetical protein ADIS_3109 [Lunatimonas lonarensis]
MPELCIIIKKIPLTKKLPEIEHDVPVTQGCPDSYPVLPCEIPSR